MKISKHVMAGLLMLATASAQPCSRLPGEWYVPGATSSKHFALVDRATGTVRVGFLSSSGETQFLPAISSGIQQVSDVASCEFGGDDIIVLTSPEANRVSFVVPLESTPIARILGEAQGIGPSGLAGIDSGSGTELAASSIFNGGTHGTRIEAIDDVPGSPSLIAGSNTTIVMSRLEPFEDPGTGTMVSIYSGPSASYTKTGMLARSGTAMEHSPKLIFAGTTHLVSNVETQVGGRILVAYRTGYQGAYLLRVSLPLSIYSSWSHTTISLPYAVSAVLPVLNGGAGPITDGVILVAADGSQAEWFQVNAAATALVSTGHVFTPEGGAAITGLLPIPGIGMVKLTGDSADGPSSSFETMRWNGAAWETADQGTLPALAPVDQNFATLLFYGANPLQDEGARLLGLQDAPDWTRRSSSLDPVPSSVWRETFVSDQGGLASATSQSVNVPGGTNYVITNQVEDGLSISSLSGQVSQLFTPRLELSPESGVYENAFQVTALYDEERYDLLWRKEPLGVWETWQGPLAVGYPVDLQFRLRNPDTGSSGAIVGRSYDISAADLANQDSDGDGVPDYVELAFALDPFGGPDSDGDGVSDLAEILDGTLPGDDSDFPAQPTEVGVGSGLEMVAVGRNAGGTEMAVGEQVETRTLRGSLLASAPVAVLGQALADGGTRGAELRSESSVPHRHLVSVATPLYFDLTLNAREGREIIRFVQAVPPPSFSPTFTPAGLDLGADAAGWMSAAQAEATSYQKVLARTIVDPEDSAVSVLLEELVHSALTEARPDGNPLPALDQFTLFPERSPDVARTAPDADDLALLAVEGFDFSYALTLADSTKAAMTALADAVYTRHVTSSEATPGMMLPIDALRSVLRGDSFPAGYEAASSPAIANAAIVAYDTVAQRWGNAIRPAAIWTVEVPEQSSGPAIYQKPSSSTEVILLDSYGDRFLLEQGMGLQPGTQFAVTGFIDTAPINGLETMEVTELAVAFIPAASDRDSDGNLLDDEWELFFFGQTGQDPYSRPHGAKHTLLQYFLDGLDPRGSDAPTTEIADFHPVVKDFDPAAAGAYALELEFPSAYQDRFEFVVESSTTMEAGSFAPVPSAGTTSLGGERLRISIPATSATGPKRFYIVRVRLK